MLLLSCLSFTTMALFCLAMEKHQKQVIDTEIPAMITLLLRPLAWTQLTFTAYVGVEIYGWSIGPVVLLGAITIALLVLILLLTYKPKLVLIVAIILPFIAMTKFCFSYYLNYYLD